MPRFGSRWHLFQRENTFFGKGSPQFSANRVTLHNRAYHGFRRHIDRQEKRSEIAVFVWESDDKYRRLQLPVRIRDKNMFCRPIKIYSFENQSSPPPPTQERFDPTPQTREGKQSQQRVQAFCLLRKSE